MVVSPPVAARRAGLRYVDDRGPGIERIKKGRRFEYRRHHGSVVRDAATLRRIASLVIPPAWTKVWICPLANGHIQATGRDARGRKQYRYHPDWRRTRDSTKYEKVLAFGEALPKLRARVAADLKRPRLDRERVPAVVVRLLETTLIRVGNEEYARARARRPSGSWSPRCATSPRSSATRRRCVAAATSIPSCCRRTSTASW